MNFLARLSGKVSLISALQIEGQVEACSLHVLKQFLQNVCWHDSFRAARMVLGSWTKLRQMPHIKSLSSKTCSSRNRFRSISFRLAHLETDSAPFRSTQVRCDKSISRVRLIVTLLTAKKMNCAQEKQFPLHCWCLFVIFQQCVHFFKENMNVRDIAMTLDFFIIIWTWYTFVFGARILRSTPKLQWFCSKTNFAAEWLSMVRLKSNPLLISLKKRRTNLTHRLPRSYFSSNIV